MALRWLFIIIPAILLYQSCGPGFQKDTSAELGANSLGVCGHPEVIDFKTHVRPILSNCVGCHGAENPSGGLNLLDFESEAFAKNNLDTFGKIVERMESQSLPMPPPPMERVSDCDVLALKKWAGLGGGQCTNKTSSPVTLRRFNSKEYQLAVKDLLELSELPDINFPADGAAPDGFKTHGEYQLFTPDLAQTLLEFSGASIQRSLNAPSSPLLNCGSSNQGTLVSKSAPYVYLFENGNNIKPVTKAQDQASWLVFEVPGSALNRNYNQLKVKASGKQSGGVWPLLKININDNTVASGIVINGESPQEVSVPFSFSANQNYKIGLHLENALADKSRQVDVVSLEFNSSGPQNLSCIETKVRQFAEKAFRKPASFAPIESHIQIANQALSKGLSFENSLQLALESILLSPHFLYQVVNVAEPDNPNYKHDLTGDELATRLSTFLWSSVPDEELLALAQNGRLTEPQVLAQQTRRMLTHAKARRFAENFSGQWLHTDKIMDLSKSQTVINDFDNSLKQSMKQETDEFFYDLIASNANPLLILNANYTFIDGNLSELYNIGGVNGEEFQKVSLVGADGRKGVLTHAGILALTSGEDETSPIKRGHFVLADILCDSPPAAPDNVADFVDESIDVSDLSVREKIAVHRANPQCASCHYSMDPIGFGLEHFDPVGQFRTHYSSNNFAVEAYGDLPEMGSFSNHEGLIDILGSKGAGKFKKCITEKMLSYGLGRPVVAADKCEVERISNEMTSNDGIVDLIVKVVTSPRFRTQQGGSQ